MRWILSFSLLLLMLLASDPLHAQTSKPTSHNNSKKPNASKQLKELLHTAWTQYLKENPLHATYLGFHQHDDILPDVSLPSLQKINTRQKNTLKRLLKIPRLQLKPQDKLNAEIFERILQNRIGEFHFNMHLIPITNRSGFHVEFTRYAHQVQCKTLKDYQSYLARLKKFPVYMAQNIALMKRGLQKGISLPKIVLKGFEGTIKPHIVKNPQKSLFYKPFKKIPAHFTPKQRLALQMTATKTILSSLVPAFQRFYDFITKQYIPSARTKIGAAFLPNGKKFYEHRIRRFTTLSLTPQQVHQKGLSEVKRILKEMKQIIKQARFKGTFAGYLKHLRTSPKYYAKTPRELMKEVSYVLKRMDGQLPLLFKRLPRIPYGIRKIPDYIAPKTTTAFYSPPPGDGSRAGFYYVNTYNLKSRPLYEIQALSFHEAVPGHHLQLAIQREQKGIPPFRRFFYFNAFIEGWALYAERLGLEVGFYKDPASNFGRLTYEMWRACRLVVDTGMHYFGWSRKKAIDYMAQRTALSLHNVTTEIDRYIAWPGQAVSYKTGELKIRALRKETQKALGAAFDLREFHDVLLKRGALPLSTLETIVRRYIQKKKSHTP